MERFILLQCIKNKFQGAICCYITFDNSFRSIIINRTKTYTGGPLVDNPSFKPSAILTARPSAFYTNAHQIVVLHFASKSFYLPYRYESNNGGGKLHCILRKQIRHLTE